MATPPITGPTKTNLDIAMQLAATMSQISEQLSQQTDAYQRQVELVEALCKAQECFGNIDPSKIKDISNALKVAHGDSEKFGKSITTTTELTGKLGEALEKAAAWAKTLSVPAQFINGFKSGLAISGQMFSGIMSLGASAFELLKNIGGIILSMPGRIIDFFASKSGGGGTDEYRQGLEEVRKEFGNLEVGTSAAIKNMTESMKNFGESGVSFGKVFGHGRAGMATLLKENLELAKEMGSNFRSLAASIGANSREFTILRKATGMTGVEAGALQLQADSTGQSLGNMVKSMSIKLAQAEQTFGISTKEFGRDINAMLKETATFGQVAPDVMIKTSAYVKKLGISIETLKKTMDASFTFEDAAQQAATLSEAFGMNIDSMKLFSEADPTKKLDQIRQSFFQAGKSVESLNIHEMKALSNATHLSDEELRRSFAMKNRGVSQASLNEQMKKGQKTEMTQQEAMVTLAKSIERLSSSGGGAGGGGFLDHFLKGFERGIERSAVFKSIVHNLERAFRVVEYAGREVGAMFLDMFPGMQDFMHGLADMLDPDKFRVLMAKVVDAFREFFGLLQTDPEGGFSTFMTRLKTIFLDFFSAESPAGSQFLNGLRDFFKTLGILFVQGLKYALESLGMLLQGIIDYMKDPSSLNAGAAAAGDGLKGMFVQAFHYAAQQLIPVLSQIGDLFVVLLKTLYEKYIHPHLRMIILGALAFTFGPALVMGFVQGVMTALLGAAIPAIIAAIRGSSALSAAAGGGGGGGLVNRGGGNFGFSNWGSGTGSAAGKVQAAAPGMAKMAAAVAIFILAAGLLLAQVILLAAMAKHFHVSPAELAIFGLAMAAIAGFFWGLLRVQFFEKLEAFGKKITWEAVRKIGVALLAMNALALAIGGSMAALIWALGGTNRDKLQTVMLVFRAFVELIMEMTIVLGILFMLGLAASAAPPWGAAAIAGLVAVGFAAVAVILTAIAELATTTISRFASRTAGLDAAAVATILTIIKAFAGLIEQLANVFVRVQQSSEMLPEGATAINPLKKVEDLLKALIDSIGGVIISLGTMTGDPNVLKEKAAIFSTIATGLGALLAPITALMGDISNDFFASGSAAAAKEAGDLMISAINVLANPTDGIIPKLMNQIKEFASGNIEPSRLSAAAGVFTSLATGLGTLIKGLGDFSEGFGGSMSVSMSGIELSNPAAKFEGLQMLVRDLFPKISEAMKGILDVVIPLGNSVTNSEGLKSIGTIMEAVSTLMGGVITAMGSFMAGSSGGVGTWAADWISGQTSAELAEQKIGTMKAKFESILGVVKDFLIGADGHSGLMGTIQTMINTIPADPEKVKGLAVVGELLKSITSVIPPIITATSEMTAHLRPGKDIDPEQIRQAGIATSGIMTSLSTSFTTLFTALPSLITQLSAMNLPPNIESQVQKISGVFELLKTLASITTGFTITQGGNYHRQANIWGEVFEPMIQLLALFVIPFGSNVPGVPNSEGHRGSFDAVLQGLAALVIPPGIEGKIASMKTVFESIKSISEASKALREIGTESTAAVPAHVMEIPLTNMARILTGITSNEATSGVPNPLMHQESWTLLETVADTLTGKAPLVTAIKDSYAQFSAALIAMTTLPTVSADQVVAFRLGAQAQGDLLNYMNNVFGSASTANAMTESIGVITSNLRGGLVTGLSSMVSAYQDFTRDLIVLSELPTIETTLETVGVRLQARNLQRIERGAVNVQLNVNIRLEAAQVTQALYNFKNTRGTAAGEGDWSDNAFIASPASTTNN